MRRSRATLTEVADLGNLARAFWLAARGKRTRPEVLAFTADLDRHLADLARDLLSGTVPVGDLRSFQIRDPKPRTIHAPCFRERVLHHALIAQIGPPLDRTLVDDTYACRPGKGTLAAVLRAQRLLRRCLAPRRAPPPPPRGRLTPPRIGSPLVRGKRARTGSSAAARGTTTPGTCARPTATRTTPATATTTWGSAWPERRRRSDGLPVLRPTTGPKGPLPSGEEQGAPACS